VLTNEEIIQNQITVVNKLGPASSATLSLLQSTMRIESVQVTDLWYRSETGSMELLVEESGATTSLIVAYEGNQHFDLEVTINDVTTRPVRLGQRKYFGGQVSLSRSIEVGETMEFGLSEIGLWINTPGDSQRTTQLTSGECYRKQYTARSVTPSVAIKTTNVIFRALLNKCKGDTFCIVSKDNRIGIYNNGVGDDQKITPITCSDEHSDHMAGVNHLVIFNSLYRRKESCMGVINQLSRLGDVDIVEYGIIEGRVYVMIEGEDYSARLTYHSMSGLNTEVEIPAVRTKKQPKRRAVTQIPVERTIDIVAQEEPTLEVEPIDFTAEEIARLGVWERAHEEWCVSRDQRYSNSRAVWFSHYSMMLIRRGEAPDELDITIMSKV